MTLIARKMTFLMILIVSMFSLFSEDAPASDAPNLSGIWKCEYDSSKHLTVERTGPVIPMSPGARTAKPQKYNFKVKLYYAGGMAKLINVAQGGPINFLHLMNIPSVTFPNMGRGNIPPLTEITMPIKDQGLFRSSHTEGENPETNIYSKLDTTVELTRGADMNTLVFEMKIHVRDEARTGSGTTTGVVKAVIHFTLKRDYPDPNVWTTAEIDLLIKGAKIYPFVPLAPLGMGETPFSNVAYYVFGDSADGYGRLMLYATDTYDILALYPYEINVEWEYPASYVRSDGKLVIGRKAFKKNALFLVSAYIHEYVHSHQSWVREWKENRETEAYCIHMDWIRARPLLPEPCNISKETLLESLEEAAKTELGRPLDCSGEYPRAEMRAKVDALNKQAQGGSRGAGEENLRPVLKMETHDPELQNWETVLE